MTEAAEVAAAAAAAAAPAARSASHDSAAARRPRVGLGVFVEREDGSFCLGQRINALGHGDWALPGGHLEFGESFEECAAREVLEETGLEMSDVRLAAVENVVFEGGDAHYVVVFMHGRASPGAEPRVLEPTKCACWHWVTWGDLPPLTLFQPLRQLAERGFRLTAAARGAE